MESDVSTFLVSCTLHFLRKLAIVEEVFPDQSLRVREHLIRRRMRDHRKLNHLPMNSFRANRLPRQSSIRTSISNSSWMPTDTSNEQRNARNSMRMIDELMHVDTVFTEYSPSNHFTATQYRLSLVESIRDSEVHLHSLRQTLESKLRSHNALCGTGLQTTCTHELSQNKCESINSMHSCIAQMRGPTSVPETQDSALLQKIECDEDRVNAMEGKLSSDDFEIQQRPKDMHALTQCRSEYLLTLKARVVHLTARLSNLSEFTSSSA